MSVNIIAKRGPNGELGESFSKAQSMSTTTQINQYEIVSGKCGKI